MMQQCGWRLKRATENGKNEGQDRESQGERKGDGRKSKNDQKERETEKKIKEQ